MEYNFGEDDDRLKQQMPYDLSEAQWEGMQHRINEQVLQDRQRQPRGKRILFSPLKITAAAAGIALLLLLTFLIKDRSATRPPDTVAVQNAEQQLDKALSDMNDQELEWAHLLNEPEINEVYEYQ